MNVNPILPLTAMAVFGHNDCIMVAFKCYERIVSYISALHMRITPNMCYPASQ